MKIGDTDTDARFSYKKWKVAHEEDIEKLKDELRAKSKAKEAKKGNYLTMF